MDGRTHIVNIVQAKRREIGFCILMIHLMIHTAICTYLCIVVVIKFSLKYMERIVVSQSVYVQSTLIKSEGHRDKSVNFKLSVDRNIGRTSLNDN